MNILIPHSWLLEHLETKATPEEIQRHTSLCGPSVERIYEREGESVYDIEVTTNRVDSMSVRGIAREVAIILRQAGIPAKLKTLSEAFGQKEITADTNAVTPPPTIHNDPTLSNRVTCVVLSNITRSETPAFMAKRLKQTDQNVHDAAIDITNYITHELGHPCHAFDYDKIMQTGGEIHVVTAQAGEQFTTLDGNTFTTVGGEVVFKDTAGKIIDLPSIKGTSNTSVDANTTKILLLLESITAEKVRFASMTHAIRTTAAQLMEKNVDPYLATEVLHRGIQLYAELCGAQQTSPIYDDFPNAQQLKPVVVPTTEVVRYLGVALPSEQIVLILEELGCVVQANEQAFTVQPPTFRPDLVIPADIIEEIARMYGYHNLPSVLMDTALPTTPQSGVDFTVEHTIKTFLAHLGLQEIYSYSMVSATLAAKTSPLEKHLQLSNPLTDDRVYLRQSLIPSLEEVFEQNTQKNKLSLFEIANIYLPQEQGLPTEELTLTIVSNESYRDVLGIVTALCKQLYINTLTVEQHSATTGILRAGAEELLQEFGAVEVRAHNRVAITVTMQKLLALVNTHPTYQPAPKTAVITEDMTFVLPEKTAVGPVLESIKKSNSLIIQTKLKDQYQNNYTFSMSYNNPTSNLTSSDIEPVRQELARVLTERHSATLVGTV